MWVGIRDGRVEQTVHVQENYTYGIPFSDFIKTTPQVTHTRVIHGEVYETGVSMGSMHDMQHTFIRDDVQLAHMVRSRFFFPFFLRFYSGKTPKNRELKSTRI